MQFQSFSSPNDGKDSLHAEQHLAPHCMTEFIQFTIDFLDDTAQISCVSNPRPLPNVSLNFLA
jgi:hypothetical protein